MMVIGEANSATSVEDSMYVATSTVTPNNNPSPVTEVDSGIVCLGC